MITVDITATESLTNVTPMTEEEARAAVDEVNRRIDSVRQKLAELHRRDGWKALGYTSWRQFAEVEFKRNRSRLYQVLNAAEVESRLLNAGVEPSKILDTPESHIRAIAKAPVTKQAEAFNLLKAWEKDGKVTEREAEAAVVAVYPNAAYEKIKALCLPLVKDGVEIPESNRTKAVSKYWKDKEKPVPKILLEILREGIEDYLEEALPSEETTSEVSSAIASTNSTELDSSQAYEIASTLNSYDPEDVAAAMPLLIEDYRVVMILRLLPQLDRKVVSQLLKTLEINADDIKVLSDSCFALCQELDQEFDIEHD